MMLCFSMGYASAYACVCVCVLVIITHSLCLCHAFQVYFGSFSLFSSDRFELTFRLEVTYLLKLLQGNSSQANSNNNNNNNFSAYCRIITSVIWWWRLKSQKNGKWEKKHRKRPIELKIITLSEHQNLNGYIKWLFFVMLSLHHKRASERAKENERYSSVAIRILI